MFGFNIINKEQNHVINKCIGMSERINLARQEAWSFVWNSLMGKDRP